MMDSEIIIGRNPVLEAIRSGCTIDKILVKEGAAEGSIKKIIGAARDNKIVLKYVDRRKLDTVAAGENHQGVIAYIAAHEYCEVSDILRAAEEKNESPFVVICDRITDPHNLGSIIRTAAGAGVHGIIIPKHDSAGLSAAVSKVSAGASFFMPVAKVTNLSKTIDELKEKGFWVTGADAGGEKSLYDADFSGSLALVIGSEGTGLSRLVLSKCDFLVSIPMRGEIQSLNASVAAALLMYEAARKRSL